jgi:hypothetical protein
MVQGTVTKMVSRLVVDLPDDLKKRLKTYCTNNGTTIHDEILSMICQNLESYEESVTSEQNPQGQPQTPLQADSCQQINEAETLRKALGLKEKERQTVRVTDGLVEREVTLAEVANHADPDAFGL